MARRKSLFEASKPAMNMSAMIDLVFLLLIFFMVTAKMVTAPQIENLDIPVANAARPVKDIKGRVMINITRDGTLLDSTGSNRLTPFDVEQLARRARESNPAAKLQIRADHEVPHKHVKEVMKASAAGGITDVAFSTYQTP